MFHWPCKAHTWEVVNYIRMVCTLHTYHHGDIFPSLNALIWRDPWPVIFCTVYAFIFCLFAFFSFFENLERLSQPGYIPTNEDILHARQATQGVQERSISVNDYSYRLD